MNGAKRYWARRERRQLAKARRLREFVRRMHGVAEGARVARDVLLDTPALAEALGFKLTGAQRDILQVVDRAHREGRKVIIRKPSTRLFGNYCEPGSLMRQWEERVLAPAEVVSAPEGYPRDLLLKISAGQIDQVVKTEKPHPDCHPDCLMIQVKEGEWREEHVMGCIPESMRRMQDRRR